MQTLFFKKKHVCASLGAVGKEIGGGEIYLISFYFSLSFYTEK